MRLTDGPLRCCEGFRLSMSWPRPLDPSAPVGRPVLPQISLSSSAAEGRALTQAGDVGPAARWRHDALGVPARNVVVNLGAG